MARGKRTTTVEENGVLYEQTDPAGTRLLCKIGGAVLCLEGAVLALAAPVPGLASLALGIVLLFVVPKRIKPKKKFLSFSVPFCGGSPTFGDWNASVHRGQSQVDRFERAAHQPLEIEEWIPETGFARIIGSTGDTHLTSLNTCSCQDFEKRSRPCKHIYFLAMKMGYTSDDFYT